MVAAYSAFATLGTRAQPMAITKIEDAKGNILWEPSPTRIPVMSPEEAWLMVSVMKDVVQRGTAAGSVGSQFRYPAGGKTGTTNDGTDVWFIGYTSDLVAGVWMGFDRPQKIKANAQGGILAAPAWTAFMNEAYKRKPAPRDWPMPRDLVSRQIDNSTNMLATAYCPPNVVTNEFFIPGTDPVLPCDVHTSYLYPDTSGVGSLYPDSLRRPPRLPGDSARRFRDTAIFSLPKRDTTRDTTRKRPPDSLRIRPPGPP
jgi:penicillin-binding protein 1A